MRAGRSYPVHPKGSDPSSPLAGVVYALGVAVNGLAVGFHVGLLDVGGQAVQVLVVREHGVAGSTEEVVVPHADKGEDHRHVLFGRGGLEVLIHLVGALVELHVVLEADAERDGKISLGVPRPKFPELVEGWAGSGYIARRSVRTCGTPAPLLQRHHSAAPRGHYP